MHSLVRPLLFTAAIAGAVAFTATPADAGNWLHGSFCTGSTSTDRSSLIVNHFHAANNDTAGARTLICPFVRTEDELGAFYSYFVMYFDRNPAASLSCRMELTDNNGVLVATPDRHSGCTADFGCNQPTSFSDTSNQARVLALITTGLPTEFLNQSFLCTVPARTANGVSGVARYYGSNN